MKDLLKDMTYYDILEVQFNAAPFEIRQAYKEALSIYSEDSLATYNLFSENERCGILTIIEEAFLTLVDERKRDKYDKSLIDKGIIDETQFDKKDHKTIPLFDRINSKGKEFYVKRIRDKVSRNDDGKRKKINLKERISGQDLKGLREIYGIDLEEIYEITRINIRTLESIESDQFEKLPPSIYLENFLKSYANLLLLNAEKICKGYLKNITSDQSE